MKQVANNFEALVQQHDSFSLEFDTITPINNHDAIVFGALEEGKIKSTIPTIGYYEWDFEKQEFVGIFSVIGTSVKGFSLEWRDLITNNPFRGYSFSYKVGTEIPFQLNTWGTDIDNPMQEEVKFTDEELDSMRDRQLGNVILRRSLITS
jgi:hypothetical protein